MFAINHRQLAIHIYGLVHSLRKTAILAQVSHMSVSRWLKTVERKQYTYTNRNHFKSDAVVDIIRTTIQNDPFISIIKLVSIIHEALGITVSKELVRVAIKRMGLTKKKARFYGTTSSLEAKTNAFLAKRANYIAANHTFVSLDETGFGRHCPITKGYAAKGARLYVRKKMPRITTTSVITCVSTAGLVSKMNVQGAVNTKIFVSYLEQLPLEAGTVVLLDNVSFHHSKLAEAAATKKGLILLFVPPYSPWFNPIEMCFSIVKRHFYKHQDIEQAFAALTPAHCDAFFRKGLSCVGME